MGWEGKAKERWKEGREIGERREKEGGKSGCDDHRRFAKDMGNSNINCVTRC